MLRSLVLFFLCALLSTACEQEDNNGTDYNPPSNSINKIMPLGASRVEGARPDFESYRYELWKLLVDGGWDFDYIGTQDDDAYYPNHSNQSFDDDHEGRGGWTSGQILNGIGSWINQAGNPDIVLFSSPGGNDALEGLSYNDAINNINEIIDIIQSANPNVTIIIEQLAPAQAAAMTPDLTTYFNQMQNDILEIASEQTTSTSSVLTVDMSSGFQESFFADEVHYNEAGATFVANRYYEVLEGVLR